MTDAALPSPFETPADWWQRTPEQRAEHISALVDAWWDKPNDPDDPHAGATRERVRVVMDDLTPRDLVAIGAVVEHPENARQGDVGAIVASIGYNGLYRRVVIQTRTPRGQPRMVVLAGNHTRKALLQCGAKALPVERLVCTDARARKVLLADNRTNDLAHYDEHALRELLEGVAQDPEDLDGLLGTAFDGDALDDLVAKLDLPSLDALAAEHADESAAGDRPEVNVRLALPGEVLDRWQSVLAQMPGTSEPERVSALLDAAVLGLPLLKKRAA